MVLQLFLPKCMNQVTLEIVGGVFDQGLCLQLFAMLGVLFS